MYLNINICIDVHIRVCHHFGTLWVEVSCVILWLHQLGHRKALMGGGASKSPSTIFIIMLTKVLSSVPKQ